MPFKSFSYIYVLIGIPIISFIGGALLLFHLGSMLSAPANHTIGKSPSDLHATPVEFSGLEGWFVPAVKGAPCVVLMHGVRADRRSMIGRAYMLRDAGYASLLFDFQAHGESPGKNITFGLKEAANARAAVNIARTQLGCTRIAAIGQSLGGAAALLGDPPIDVQALVVESVYPTINDAVADRLALRLGSIGRVLTPLLTMQLKLRLGIDPESLRPIDKIAQFHHPILVLAGTEDRHTTIEESRELFDSAQQPKEFWAVRGATHVDLYRFDPQGYRHHVLPFLARYLSAGESRHKIEYASLNQNHSLSSVN